ncbi:hypothetical protein GCM10009555_107780 [Acrocarpospora macrocephala]|uniref:Uncharacterized protein n=1 Tax=Acrocarpospora macrocephala TaxID=150177 RepID=A0A5M3XBV2_9ACTN|nr:hypothetical protein [Acrocarpospora macrocephala]GES16981.1 hypothetical protein Amac_105790 [Acrocarpospora macrocephala]
MRPHAGAILARVFLTATCVAVVTVGAATSGHAESPTPVANDSDLAVVTEGPLNNPQPDGTIVYAANADTTPSCCDPNVPNPPPWISERVLRSVPGGCDPSPCIATGSALAMARNATGTVIAARGADNSLNTYWRLGANQWVKRQAALPGTTISAPSLARRGNTTVLAAQGAGNRLNFYWSPDNGANWYPQMITPDGTAFSAPSIADNGTATVITVRGPGDNLKFYWAANGTSNWHVNDPTATVDAAGSTFSAPAIAQDAYNTVITALGPDRSLNFYWAVNGVAAWHKHPVHGPAADLDPIGTYSAPSISMTSTTAVISALGRVRDPMLGVINTLQFYWNIRGVPQWNKSPTTERYSPLTPPSIANNGASTVIAARSGYRNLGVYWAINGTDTWNHEPVGRPYIP